MEKNIWNVWRKKIKIIAIAVIRATNTGIAANVFNITGEAKNCLLATLMKLMKKLLTGQ